MLIFKMPFEVVKVKNSLELWEFRLNHFFRLLELFTSRNYVRGGGHMVSALVSRSNSPGSSPGRRHFVVFLGMTVYSNHPGV